MFLGLTAVFITVLMACFSWFYKYDTRLDNWKQCWTLINYAEVVDKISFNAVYVANILTNHGKYVKCVEWIKYIIFFFFGKSIGIFSPFTKYSFRILAGCWLLAALVLVNSYSSIVVSSLTLPQMKPTIESFEDLAASEEVSIVLRKDFAISQEILVCVYYRGIMLK